MASVLHMNRCLMSSLGSDHHVRSNFQEDYGVLCEESIFKRALDETGISGVFIHAMWLVVPLSNSITYREGLQQCK